MSKTLEYYDNNADQFVKGTLSVDFRRTQEHFLEKLPSDAYILDFGCGSGRDTKYFLDRGYVVDAIDGSAELCKIASDYTGINVKQMLFEELSEVEKYDGIWACSSILHLSKETLKDVFHKMGFAIKNNGIVYTSFKFGDFEGERNGRYFTDFRLDSFKKYLKDIPEFSIEEHWISGDVRPDRGGEKWLNLILQKSGIN